MAGAPYVLIALLSGLATGIVGRGKGSSFFIWFLVGTVLPILGLIAVILYRSEHEEPERRRPRGEPHGRERARVREAGAERGAAEERVRREAEEDARPERHRPRRAGSRRRMGHRGCEGSRRGVVHVRLVYAHRRPGATPREGEKKVPRPPCEDAGAGRDR